MTSFSRTGPCGQHRSRMNRAKAATSINILPLSAMILPQPQLRTKRTYQGKASTEPSRETFVDNQQKTGPASTSGQRLSPREIPLTPRLCTSPATPTSRCYFLVQLEVCIFHYRCHQIQSRRHNHHAELISDAESDGVSYCAGNTSEASCADRPSFPAGFISAAVVHESDDGSWIQVC